MMCDVLGINSLHSLHLDWLSSILDPIGPYCGLQLQMPLALTVWCCYGM